MELNFKHNYSGYTSLLQQPTYPQNETIIDDLDFNFEYDTLNSTTTTTTTTTPTPKNEYTYTPYEDSNSVQSSASSTFSTDYNTISQQNKNDPYSYTFDMDSLIGTSPLSSVSSVYDYSESDINTNTNASTNVNTKDIGTSEYNYRLWLNKMY